MAIRNIKDAVDLSTGEKIFFKSHAKATYMSNGMTVEDAINQNKTIQYNTIDGTLLDITLEPETINIWNLNNSNASRTISINTSKSNSNCELLMTIDNARPDQLIFNNTIYWKDGKLPELDALKMYKIKFVWNDTNFILANWEEYPIDNNEESSIPIKVMDLNIKTSRSSYSNINTSHTWENRKDELIGFINGNLTNDQGYTITKCDIIGLQEIYMNGGQWDDIFNVMSDEYGSILANRGDSSSFLKDSEAVAILYRKDRFTRVSGGYFWLRGGGWNGDTGDYNQEGISMWDKEAQEDYAYDVYKRIAVWIILKDITTNKEFFVLNTHYNKYFYNDNVTAASTPYYSSELVKNRIEALSGGRPVIFLGDLHCNPDKSAIGILKPNYYKLYDSRDIAENVIGMKYTMNSWSEEDTNPTYAIFDYIFVTNDFTVNQFITPYAKVNGTWISDHNPIIADLYLKM